MSLLFSYIPGNTWMNPPITPNTPENDWAKPKNL